MKKLKFVLASIGLLVMPTPTAAQPHTVTDNSVGVSIIFPEKPEQEPKQACPDVPDCQFLAWEYTDYGTGENYCTFNLTVAEFFNNDGRVFTNPHQAAQWALLQSYSPDDEILSDVDISNGTISGREMLVRLAINSFGTPTNYHRNNIKVMVRANRIYSASARCDERVNAKAQRAFMASFRLF